MRAFLNRVKIFFGNIGKFFRNMSLKKRIVFGIGVFLLLVTALTVGYYFHLKSLFYVPTGEDPLREANANYESVPMEKPLYDEVEGITNILLIGVDSRSLNERSRSDSIIIATIDSNNKKVKFTSIMRDSYVEIPTHSPEKINSAYEIGGAELLMKTLELNFRIKIDKYIVVNFWGFQDIIDAVGGIDVDIKQSEIKELNKYIGDLDTPKTPQITEPGLQHLDGQQALAYSRIRKNDSDYNRTGRQREVLSILVDKLKKTSVFEYQSLMEKMAKCVRTNIEPLTLLNYAYTVSKFEPVKIEQLQIPVNEISWGGMYNGAWMLLLDRNQNAKVMNDFIFADKIADVKALDINAFKSILKEYKSKETKINVLNENNEIGSAEPADVPKAADGGTTSDHSSSGTENTTASGTASGTESNNSGANSGGTATSTPDSGTEEPGTTGDTATQTPSA